LSLAEQAAEAALTLLIKAAVVVLVDLKHLLLTVYYQLITHAQLVLAVLVVRMLQMLLVLSAVILCLTQLHRLAAVAVAVEIKLETTVAQAAVQETDREQFAQADQLLLQAKATTAVLVQATTQAQAVAVLPQ
jgi:hypothetical protein